MKSKIAILVGAYFTDNDGWRPPLALFFDRLFESLKDVKHDYRVVLSDDGSNTRTKQIIGEIGKLHPSLEIHLRDHNVGECLNLHYMTSLLRDEEYIFYVSNDCYVRNLDKVDWLDVMKDIIDTNDCTASTIQAGYPASGDWSWTPFGIYQKFNYVSTRHFMMKRDRYDKINWPVLIDHIKKDSVGLRSWEAWLNNMHSPVTTLGYSNNRLGIWHVAPHSVDKINKICYTDTPLSW